MSAPPEIASGDEFNAASPPPASLRLTPPTASSLQRSPLPAWAKTPAATKWAFRLGLLFVLLLAAGHITLLYRDTKGWLVDDAYIAFRYAENWADGLGLVFNVGERVEGYTCFLWVALLTLGKLLGASVIGAARVAGVGLTLGTAALLYAMGVRKIGPRFGWLPALLFSLNHSIMTWSFGGLEVPLYLFLVVLGAFLLFVVETPWFLLAFAGAALTRPDGHIFAVLGAVFLLAMFRDRPRKTRLAVLAAAFVPLLAFEAFRIGYYHALLPNTFYVKVDFGTSQLVRGFDYLQGATGAYCLFLPAALFLWLSRGPFSSWRAFLLALGAGYGSFVIYAGGDPLPGYRFALPLPVLAWLALATLLAEWGAASLAAPTVLSALLVWNDVSQEIPRGKEMGGLYKHFRDDKVGECGANIGRWLDRNAAPGALVATNTGGSIPYFARRQRALDMLGLTDAHIARAPRAVGQGYVGHEKFDPKYVYERRPDYIFICFSCNTSGPCLGGDKDLLRMPGFDAAYRKRDARHEGFSFSFYERKDAGSAR
jgi:hypothetical protein